MASSNTYSTTSPGSGASNREDLAAISTILAPEETPVLSMASKSKADATYHEWTVDKLDDPDTSGVAEGADVTAFDDKFENLARLGNRVQKFRRDFKVTDWQEAVESAAPANFARAEAKAMKELKRDVEAALMSDNDRVVGSGTAAAKLRGLGDWLDSAGPSDVPSDYRTPSGSIDANGTSITESQFNDVIQSIHDENGEVNNLTGVFASALRRTISDFTRSEGSSTATAYNVNQPAGEKKITLAVNIYDSDFGLVKFTTANPKCVPATDRGYLLNPNYYGVAELIPMGSRQLEDQGGGPRGYCDCSLTLKVDSPLAHGKIS